MRSKRYRMLLKVPCKFLIFRWLQNCQGSGVGSIPIGRFIFPRFSTPIEVFPRFPFLVSPINVRRNLLLRGALATLAAWLVTTPVTQAASPANQQLWVKTGYSYLDSGG